MTSARFLWGPGALYSDGSVGPRSTQLFNTANIGVAVRFTVPRAGTIVSVAFNVTAKSGADRTIQARVVGLTTGVPNTSLHGGSAAGTLSITGTGHKTVTLATPATVAVGQQIAVRLDPSGTAPDGANNFTVQLNISGISGDDHLGWPNTCTTADAGVTWALSLGIPVLALLMGDGTYIFADLGDSPQNATTALTSYTSADTPNEYGARFQVPYAMSCVGIRMVHRAAGAALNSTARLYDSDGSTVLGTGVHYSISGAVSPNVGYWHWPAVALSANHNYFIGLTNGSAVTAQKEPYYLTVQAVAEKPAWPMMDGSRWSHATRTGAGAWTVTATRVPLMAVVCDGVG